MNADALRMGASRRIDAGPSHSCLIKMRSGDGRSRPLFLIHSIGGTAMQFAPLVRALRSERPIYYIRPRGTSRGESPHLRVEDMAGDYLDAIHTVQPRGPYSIVGFSFGGLVALEIAQRVLRDGDTVDLLAMLDTTVDPGFLSWPDWLCRVRIGLGCGISSMLSMEPGCRRSYLTDRLSRLGERIVGMRVRLGFTPTPPRIKRSWQSPHLPPALRRVQDAIAFAITCYRPTPYPGRIVFVQAEAGRPRYAYPASIWRRIAREGVEVSFCPGEHETMVQPPNVECLAALLARYL